MSVVPVESLALLLKEGTQRGKKDVVTALFNLSTHPDCSVRMVESGAVSALAEAAGATALLVRQQTAVEVVRKDDATVSSLVSLIRRGSAKGEENTVSALHELCRSGGVALTQKVAGWPYTDYIVHWHKEGDEKGSLACQVVPEKRDSSDDCCAPWWWMGVFVDKKQLDETEFRLCYRGCISFNLCRHIRACSVDFIK